MKQKGKIWVDSSGRETPSKIVSRVFKLEEKHSQSIFFSALKAEKYLKDVVEKVFLAYDEISLEKIRLADIKGKHKNINGMTFTSFDGSIEVKITKPFGIYFDKTYSDLVKDKFNEYFNTIDKRDDEVIMFLRNIVSDLLFSKSGNIDQEQVNRLREHKNNLIETGKDKGANKIFVEAVDLFDKAIRRKRNNTGIYISFQDKQSGNKRPIALKLTDVYKKITSDESKGKDIP